MRTCYYFLISSLVWLMSSCSLDGIPLSEYTTENVVELYGTHKERYDSLASIMDITPKLTFIGFYKEQEVKLGYVYNKKLGSNYKQEFSNDFIIRNISLLESLMRKYGVCGIMIINDYKEVPLNPSVEFWMMNGNDIMCIRRHKRSLSDKELQHYRIHLFSKQKSGLLDKSTIWYFKE